MRDGDGDGQDTAELLRTAEEGDALVIAVLRRHGDTVLRIARRNSACDEDAADASQRALEIFVRHVRRLDAATAHRWLFRVVRNEAVAVREQRHRHLAPVELHADLLEARHAESPEDRVIGLEATAQAAEALQALKTSDLQALVMQASGDSYALIAQRAGWSATKVNRVITEGRRRLRQQRDAIAEGRECDRWRPVLAALVDGHANARDLAAVRPHLRHCVACRAHVRTLHREATPAPTGGGARMAALAPLGLLGWLTRVHDAVPGALGERLATRALQLQSAAEAFSAGKVAAVAASAAALATGGAAVVQSGLDAHDVRHHTPAARSAATRSVRRPPAASRATALRVTATIGGPLRAPAPVVAARGRASGLDPGPGHAPGRRAPEFPGRAAVRPVAAELVALRVPSPGTPRVAGTVRELGPSPSPPPTTPSGEFSRAAPTARAASAAAPHAGASGGGEFAP
jgi:RNA polymerase sigma factor (sigma-70 family)